jgi:hypothetical protein
MLCHLKRQLLGSADQSVVFSCAPVAWWALAVGQQRRGLDIDKGLSGRSMRAQAARSRQGSRTNGQPQPAGGAGEGNPAQP